jgi:hypothetical protein
MGSDSRRIDQVNLREAETVYLSESGLWSLILRSNRSEAKAFRRWVTSALLPSLRKSGGMSPTDHHLGLCNEKRLHYAVTSFIRSFLPEALLAPGSGELQDSRDKRSDAWAKGYRGGQPDILLLNHHKKFNGFALELKTPLGVGKLSIKQESFMSDLSRARYRTLVSSDYNEIVVELMSYFADARVCCPMCSKRFKSSETLTRHLQSFHKS